jgi:pyruvate dehydrogenase E2 component (dihydrolipoamide acetyltransferase)
MSLVDLVVPDIGEHADVDVVEVCVRVGDRIEPDQTLVTLETDKATMDVPATHGGKLVECLVAVGDKISKGSVIARIEVEAGAKQVSENLEINSVPVPEQALAQSPSPQAETQVSSSLPKLVSTSEYQSSEQISSFADFSNVHASPSIRRLARELGVDLNKVKGSGRKGRVSTEDVKSFVKQFFHERGDDRSTVENSSGLSLIAWPKVDFSKFGPTEIQNLSKIKKISGANLARNWAMIPHVTQFDQADITEMEAFRKQMSEELKEQSVKLTPLAFLMKAVVVALKKFPDFNSSLDGEQLIYKKYYHIGFAADTPNGLVVPVVRDVDRKNLLDIARETSLLAAKARDGKLLPQEMQGGCFSISSLGGIGGTAFTPIINAPEVAILGVSKSQMQPVWNGGEFNPRLILPLSLSYDHRVIDGASAARFTTYLAKILGDVRRLML